MSKFSIGDVILINSDSWDSKKFVVEGIIGSVYLGYDEDSDDHQAFVYSEKELASLEARVDDGTKEVTLEQVAEKFGVDVSEIRIKE